MTLRAFTTALFAATILATAGPSIPAMAQARAAAPAPAPRPATAQRPNFLVIVADDLGYSDLGAFGGEILTPNLDALALSGVRLTGFHTAPTCSPTRSMLLSGTDNHVAGLGTMAELINPAQQGRQGYEGYLNDDVASVAELLSDGGYQTLMVGKWHLGLTEERSPAARGFQKSFALLQGLQHHFGDNQAPEWTEVGEPVTFREGRALATYPTGTYDADYFADRMIGFLKETRKDQPFFGYLTFTQPHWPLQAPAALIAKYKGRYDAGPEALRQARLAKLKTLGLIPANTEAHPLVGSTWAGLTPDQKANQIRRMEVYAAMVESMDQNVGRVIQQLKDSGQYDNTVIVFLSDNGAEGSVLEAPGGKQGKPPPPAEVLAKVGIDNSLAAMGSAKSWVTYGPDWAQAATAPSRLVKGYTTEGGIHTPAFVSGPGVQGARISNAFLHVKDITPTLLDLAGVAHPDTFHGRKIAPLQGHSWTALLRGQAAEVRPADEAVGWELFYRRAIRRGDWKAVFLPKTEGSPYAPTATIAGDWELFNLKDDPAEQHDLARREPERLKSLIEAWQAYAAQNHVVAPPPATAAAEPQKVAAR